MASAFTAVDMSLLSPPDVVEKIDFETVLAAMVADLQERDSSFDALLESDPAYKILEVAAYRETLLRQRVNEATRAVMLTYAAGTDLDQIAANYNVSRQVIDPGDPDAIPPVDPTYETDIRLRYRVQLAFEGLSTAGPIGAYQYHAVSADSHVADIDVASPDPGEVVITVLSTDGVPDEALLETVETALNADDVRPLTDQVSVQAAKPVNYSVSADLTLYDGPDGEVVRATSEASIAAFVADQRKLGEPITIDGLHKALRVDGVKKVTLIEPAMDVEPTNEEFGNCSAIVVTLGGE